METPIELWQKQETISTWILISILFIIGLIGILIYILTMTIQQRYTSKLQQQRAEHQNRLALHQATLESIEAERKRFAHELHDGIIGKMTALRYGVQLNLASAEIDLLIGACIEESRNLSHQLYPPMLQESSLDLLIQHCIRPYQGTFTLSYTMDMRADFPLTQQQKLHIIRIIQELLTNTVKHAHATAISLTVRMDTAMILRYSDNGLGLANSGKQGLGLQSIHDRVIQLRGSIKIYTLSHAFKTLIYIPR